MLTRVLFVHYTRWLCNVLFVPLAVRLWFQCCNKSWIVKSV